MDFNQINFNAFSYESELCKIGLKYQTDKSPLCNNLVGFHAYTPFYNTLFSSIRYNDIVFGEIGIYKNASMKMWREYFPNATLYGWDCRPEYNVEKRYCEDFIELAKNDNLDNVIYDYMNVKDEHSIISSMQKCNTKFDIILEDSDHKFWSQFRVISQSVNFLKPGGMLIIEDVGYGIWEYFSSIQEYGHDKFYSSLTQVKTSHNNQKYGSDYDELIVLIRNGVNQ